MISGYDRRSFLKTALAVGGASALSACVEREGDPDVAAGTPDGLPDRQFAWNEYLPKGPHGNVKLPNHQLLLFLTYGGDGTPTEAEREQVEGAFRTLERAYQWGTGGAYDVETTRGLLFMVAYAPRYFDRFDADLPEGVTVPPPESVLDELGEDAPADEADAVLVLTSDDVRVLLAAEQALRGRTDELNGDPVASSLAGVFDVVDRRTGFLGVGRPARELEADVPEKSPTAMGYRSGFKDNQATEERVAITVGPFRGGTKMHVSRLEFDLEAWYDLDEDSRVHRMFSPTHTPEEVGEIGEALGGRSRITRETVKRTAEDATDHNLVGHTQKVAGARDENFEPKLLRRSEGVSTDLPSPAMNFISLQASIEHFIEARRSMDCPAHGGDTEGSGGGSTSGCPAHTVDVPEENNGITGFLETLRRGTYLVPPRPIRSLPTPDSDARE